MRNSKTMAIKNTFPNVHMIKSVFFLGIVIERSNVIKEHYLEDEGVNILYYNFVYVRISNESKKLGSKNRRTSSKYQLMSFEHFIADLKNYITTNFRF